jgi:hypothetical protein
MLATAWRTTRRLGDDDRRRPGGKYNDEVRGEDGWGFMIKDSTHLRWITLTYRTEAEAKAAREQIKAATTGVIDAVIA